MKSYGFHIQADGPRFVGVWSRREELIKSCPEICRYKYGILSK